MGRKLFVFFLKFGDFFLDFRFSPFSMLFAAFWSWKLPFPRYVQRFWVRTSHFPLYFPRYLQQFAACSVHFPCSLQHFWAGICISTVCATFYSYIPHSTCRILELKADIPTVVCCYCYCCWCWCWCCCCWWCCCCCWWWWWSCCCCCCCCC